MLSHRCEALTYMLSTSCYFTVLVQHENDYKILEYYQFRNGAAILISTCPLKSDSIHILVNVYLIHLKLKFVPILIFDLSLPCSCICQPGESAYYVLRPVRVWPRFWICNIALISYIVSIQPQGINLQRAPWAIIFLTIPVASLRWLAFGLWYKKPDCSRSEQPRKRHLKCILIYGFPYLAQNIPSGWFTWFIVSL